MYIDNRKPQRDNEKTRKKQMDMPDGTRKIPFAKVPVPDVIELDGKK